MTAASILTGHLTGIGEVYISTSLSFSRLLQEKQRNLADSGNSIEYRRFCEHLVGFSWNFMSMHSFLDCLVKACRCWTLAYLRISMELQADSVAKL